MNQIGPKITGALTSGNVPRATGTSTLGAGSWTDTGTVLSTTSTAATGALTVTGPSATALGLRVTNGSPGAVTATTYSVASLENSSHAYLNFLVPAGFAAGMIIGQGTNSAFSSLTYNRTAANAWDITTGVAGTESKLLVSNTDNANGASNANLTVSVGGASSGDPYVGYTINAVQSWSTGVDNSDGDKFKISAGGVPGNLDAVAFTTARDAEFFGSVVVDVALTVVGATTLNGNVNLGDASTDVIKFFGGTGSAKPTITGSRGANAALADLLTKLATMGLIVDGTTV